MDGWGKAVNTEVSAIDAANTPFVDSMYERFSNSTLEASGLAVGLPEGQMGNSEVGHMNLGAGRIVYQDLVRINNAVSSNELGNEKILVDALNSAISSGKKIHFMGLLSDGGVHSHINHLKGLLSLANDLGAKDNVYVHAFTDGRDTDPMGGKDYLADLENHMQNTTGKVASMIGRYYAMDRDNRWERVKLAYDVMVKGEGESFGSAMDAITTSYGKEVTDEFLNPVILDNNGTIEDGDFLMCFNFRTDRGREISQALTQVDYPEQGMSKLDLNYVTMTNYDDNFKGVKVVFDKDNLKNTLGEVLEGAGKKQIRIAETEKYPHVTFFFSGGRETEFNGESRILCPSPKVATYDLQPEMSAHEIKTKIKAELVKGEVDFVCLNFANPDMVGHTGIFEAAVKACETVDECVNEVVSTGIDHGYSSIVIADHGNADCMSNPDGSPNTAHTTALVPFILADKDYKPALKAGKLGDIAPTILALLGVDQPADMTGESLLG